MKATLPLAAALIAILMLGTPAAAASSPTSPYFHLTRPPLPALLALLGLAVFARRR